MKKESIGYGGPNVHQVLLIFVPQRTRCYSVLSDTRLHVE